MKLFIVRHGETIENQEKTMMGHHHGTLTNLGLKQAREVAKELKDYNFVHIYSSDLRRCVDTAEIIKEFHPDTPLTFTKELRELNLGEYQGLKRDEVDWDSLGSDVMARKPKGGESLNELRKRTIDFTKELYKIHPKDQLLLVTHAGVIRQIISFFEGIPSRVVFENIPIGNGEVFEVRIGKEFKGEVLNLPGINTIRNKRSS